MNPILLNIGPIQIYWYSFLLFIGFSSGALLTYKEAIKQGLEKDKILDLFFYIVVFSLLGARIYYVLFNLNEYMLNPIDVLKVWEGGMAIHGGIIGGIITIYYFSKKNNLNPIKVTDMFAISLALGQAIGRWGNFMNGEAHGPITTLSHLKDMHIPDFIIKGMYIDGKYYIPTFLYESLSCLLLALILYIIRKNKNNKIGYLTGLYLIFYSVERFVIEGLRTDSLMLFNIKVAQLISIIMILIGAIIIVKANKKYNEKDFN